MSLSCPEPDNYAAIAKQLHKTAVQAEAQIYSLEYQLRAAANRPTIMQTTTSLITGLGTGSENLIGPTFAGIFLTNFNNTALPSSESIANNVLVFNVLGEGVYEVGITGNVIASGVADANSFRVIRAQHYTPDPSSLGPIQLGYRLVNSFGYTAFESNVGNGVDFSLAGEFRCKPLDIIFFTLLHNNTSSTLNLSIGCIGWLSKVSGISLTAVL